MPSSLHSIILCRTRRLVDAVEIKTAASLAFVLMLFAAAPSWAQDAYLAPCKDQLHMWQQDPNLRDQIKGWYCPNPNARAMPVPPAGGQSSAVGGIPMSLPTTEGQAMVTVMGWMLQGILSGGSAADQQQQQALLQQKQAEEKMKAEMLQKERAAQAIEARALWESQDATRSQELGSLFGPSTEKASGLSSLLQKQAALQLRAVAVPVNPGTDESLRQGAGEGFDEAGKSLIAVPVIPESDAPLDQSVILAQIDEAKSTVGTLDKELEKIREKHEKTRNALDQARRDLTAKQADEPGSQDQTDDAALLAALEAEERNIEMLSREVEASSAQLKVLEDQRHNAVQDLDMWNGKLEAVRQ